MRLGPEALAGLPAGVARPAYDRAAQAVGIVHFGIGAFHRAHMAWYTDRAMAAGDADWMITGVSLRSTTVAEQLNPQHGLYTLAERSAAGTTCAVLGAVARVLVASSQRAEVLAALAAPATRIVSFTVTEKGYCRRADHSLDLALADAGFYPLLAEAFARRRAAGLSGLTLLSCDNLADNGRQLAALMGDYLAARAPDLAGWFADECACPSTMVDRIVPATTPADLDAVAAELGLRDAAAVLTEPFSQWVIEDRFAGPRPRWEAVGAELVAEVAPYERAKLRMLNGAHSALAYLGLQRGHAFVHQAVADSVIRDTVERLMRDEAAPTVGAAPGHDLMAYADALLARFANPALNHRLAQIAMDGSQKVPQRWLEPLADNQRAGRDCPATLAALAGWLRHLRGDNCLVDDPLAEPLARAWREHGAAGIVPALFGPGGLVSDVWHPTMADRVRIEALLGEG